MQRGRSSFGQGAAYNLARRKIIARGGMLAVMGGGLFYQGILGVKTYTVVKGSYSFQVSLYDADTGKLLCYTQANRLGQLRSGATTGVAVKYLANPDAATVGIIGAGYQAPTPTGGGGQGAPYPADQSHPSPREGQPGAPPGLRQVYDRRPGS